MSNVSLAIGGRHYTVACADGEEAHILGLGRIIDNKLASLPDAAGLSEIRALLFASLLLADEVHEARAKGPRQAELGLDATPAPAPVELEAVAARLERLAASLEAAA